MADPLRPEDEDAVLAAELALDAPRDGPGQLQGRHRAGHLEGHVHATAGSHELHIQTFGLVITLGLRQHPRPKCGQCARRGQEVGHLLKGCLRLSG